MSDIETRIIDQAFTPPFELIAAAADKARPVLFDSPHSGAHYPARFQAMTRLAPDELRGSEDSYIDELFDQMPAHGAGLLRAHFPRAYLDVNRESYELDPRLFSGRLPDYANRRSVRVNGGLGTVPRLITEGMPIYPGKLPVSTAFTRINRLYKPYHRALASELKRLRGRFGYAVLIDCHSMPSQAGGMSGNAGGQLADIVLGDRFGKSCAHELTGWLEQRLQAKGWQTALNRPYAGGFITEHYGRPMMGMHAIQIEINRAIYMNERSYEKTPRFAQLKADLTEVMAALLAEIDQIIPGTSDLQAAAE